MDYLATFLEGIITFVSPCLLPMLPLYVAYFAGDSSGAAAAGKDRLGRTLAHAISFVLGFSLVFVLLGVAAGAFGELLVQYSMVVNVLCGLVIVYFGLHYAGVLNSRLLSRTLKPQLDVKPNSVVSSFVFGVVFAVGWTPCVGVFLGSALALAAVGSSATKGLALLLCYSLGLAIPFVISAVAIDQLAGAFDAIRRHYGVINKVCGALLIVMGVLMATGLLETWMRSLA